MVANSVVVIASTGPFGPTLSGVLILLLLLVAPFVLAVIAARSLLAAEPISWWLVGILWIGAMALGYLLWQFRMDWHWTGFWGVWRILGIASVVLTPVVMFKEAGKRDFFRRINRQKKPSPKKQKAKRTRANETDEPPRSHGAFVRDEP